MWRKITIGLIIAVSVILIGYDIIVVLKSPGDTLSNIMMSTIWKFPFIGYSWLLLAGHFLSLIPTKKRYIKQFVVISLAVFAFSFLVWGGVVPVSSGLLAIVSMIGFAVGTCCWSQRRK